MKRLDADFRLGEFASSSDFKPTAVFAAKGDVGILLSGSRASIQNNIEDKSHQLDV